MTVANQTNRTSAVGSGSTGQEVPFSFPITVTSDLTVIKRVTATGVETTLAETTNYTVSIFGDTGGTLTTVTAIETTEQIHIIRATSSTQLLDLEQGGSFNAENVEDAFDKNTKLSIENADGLARTLVFPDTDPSSSFADMPSSIDRASKYLTFDSTGKPTVSVAVEEGSVSFTAFGTNMAEAANAAAGRDVIGLDTDDDVEFAGITGTTGTFTGATSATTATLTNLITKGPWVDVKHPDFGAVGDGVTDDGPAIAAAFAYLESLGGGTLFFPKATYMIFTGSSYTLMATMTDVTGIKIEGNWSTLNIDPSNDHFDATPNAGAIFTFHNCHNVSVNHFNITGKTDPAFGVSYFGIAFVIFDQGSTGLSMPHNRKTGGGGCGLLLGSTGDTDYVDDIDIGILEVSNNVYGITGQYFRDNMRIGMLVTNNVLRSLFLIATSAPIKNLHAVIYSTNPQGFVDVFLKMKADGGLADTYIKYISDSRSIDVATNTRVAIVYQSPTDAVTAKNITFDFDVEFAAAGDTGFSLFGIWKYIDDSTEDTTDRGHRLENLIITGSIEGTPSIATGPIMYCGDGIPGHGHWGTGDYWTNIKLENLIITGTRPIQFVMDSLVDNFTLINVSSVSNIGISPTATQSSYLTNGLIKCINCVFPNQYVGSASATPVSLVRLFPTGTPFTIIDSMRDKPIYNDWIGAANYVLNLPASVVGDKYIFVRTASGTLRIDPNGAEIIRGGGAGKYLEMDDQGGSVTLICLVAGTWDILASNGALSYE